jgi:hypothetical protein
VSEQGEYAKGLETGLVAGKNYERSRLILLLENMAKENFGYGVEDVLARIKGEQS